MRGERGRKKGLRGLYTNGKQTESKVVEMKLVGEYVSQLMALKAASPRVSLIFQRTLREDYTVTICKVPGSFTCTFEKVNDFSPLWWCFLFTSAMQREHLYKLFTPYEHVCTRDASGLIGTFCDPALI